MSRWMLELEKLVIYVSILPPGPALIPIVFNGCLKGHIVMYNHPDYWRYCCHILSLWPKEHMSCGGKKCFIFFLYSNFKSRSSTLKPWSDISIKPICKYPLREFWVNKRYSSSPSSGPHFFSRVKTRYIMHYSLLISMINVQYFLSPVGELQVNWTLDFGYLADYRW